MKLKEVLLTAAISAVTTVGVIWGYGKYQDSNKYAGQENGVLPSNYHLAGLHDSNASPNGAVDFTQPAQIALPTVVHIKTKTNAKQVNNNLPRQRSPFGNMFDDDLFNQFFNGPSVIPEQRASGSGVIISDDGYIVTNNHVVADADEITVTLSNKKTYNAKVIGTDPSYDLPVIKIDAKG